MGKCSKPNREVLSPQDAMQFCGGLTLCRVLWIRFHCHFHFVVIQGEGWHAAWCPKSPVDVYYRGSFLRLKPMSRRTILQENGSTLTCARISLQGQRVPADSRGERVAIQHPADCKSDARE
jgi:hypothetical protein